MPTALASIDDYQDLTGLTVAPADAARIQRLLGMASATVRRECRGQIISQVTGDEFVREGEWAEVIELPQFPVTNVASVTVNGALIDSSAYRWNQAGELRRVFNATGSMTTGWGGPGAYVDVVYDHGYNPVPDEVIAVVCGVVHGQVTNPLGVRSETIGQRTVTYGGDGSSFGTGLILGPNEKAVLKQFWRHHRTITLDIQPIDHTWPTYL